MTIQADSTILQSIRRFGQTLTMFRSQSMGKPFFRHGLVYKKSYSIFFFINLVGYLAEEVKPKPKSEEFDAKAFVEDTQKLPR